MPKIIAFTGKKGSGKTTACQYYINKGYKHINFKDALVKEMKQRLPDVLERMSEEHGLSIDELFKFKPTLMRRLMQNYGTNVRRGDDPEYWTQKWLDAVENEEFVVCDDVRFVNEAHAVRVLGGTIVKIWKKDQAKDNHISELEMEDIFVDHLVENNGSIKELHSNLSSLGLCED